MTNKTYNFQNVYFKSKAYNLKINADAFSNAKKKLINFLMKKNKIDTDEFADQLSYLEKNIESGVTTVKIESNPEKMTLDLSGSKFNQKFDLLYNGLLKEDKNDKFSGNCGMYAIALAKNAKDNNKEPIIVIISDTDDNDELLYGEPNVYHVAVEIDGKLYDGNGLTSLTELGDFVYNIYGDTRPFVNYYNFNDSIIQVIRSQTNWDTQWQVYYNELKNNKKNIKKNS